MFNFRKTKVEDPLAQWSQKSLWDACNSLKFEKQLYGDEYKHVFNLKELIKTHRAFYDEMRKYDRIVSSSDEKIWFSRSGNIIEKHERGKQNEKLSKTGYKISWCKLPK